MRSTSAADASRCFPWERARRLNRALVSWTIIDRRRALKSFMVSKRCWFLAWQASFEKKTVVCCDNGLTKGNCEPYRDWPHGSRSSNRWTARDGFRRCGSTFHDREWRKGGTHTRDGCGVELHRKRDEDDLPSVERQSWTGRWPILRRSRV